MRSNKSDDEPEPKEERIKDFFEMGLTRVLETNESLRDFFEKESGEFLRNFGKNLPLFGDILESDDEVMVLVDVPGCRKEDIKVTVVNGGLKIDAMRHKPLEEGFEYVGEARPETVSGTIPLPSEVVSEEASATYENGVLNVRMPKAETKTSIEVGTADDDTESED